MHAVFLPATVELQLKFMENNHIQPEILIPYFMFTSLAHFLGAIRIY